MRNNWFSYDIMTEAIFDYMGPVGGLLYGWCMAGVAGAWFILTGSLLKRDPKKTFANVHPLLRALPTCSHEGHRT